MSPAKHRLSALPLAQNILTQHLTPDSNIPNVPHFVNNTLQNNPSIQRRSRLLPSQCHFSYVTPLPLPFPYEIAPPEIEETGKDKANYVERWLAEREPSMDTLPETVHKFSPKPGIQEGRRELIGISETALRDCLPQLDVGDAFQVIGTPALAPTEEPIHEGQNEARQEFVDILSGHATLLSSDFAPWSLRYSGHQFGSFAGQLGDGRAISVHAVQHPSNPELSYELQLKGSGRTPFSRSADGLAVLRSSIREFLCSEAMQALRIPTTRALSLVYLPDLPVIRERQESASIVTRLAPSFIRIGNFEAFSPPHGEMFFFGGGQQKANYEGLRILGEWVADKVLQVRKDSEQPWGRDLVMEVAKRNAEMVAGWQAYGFMHGVINTDNVSILGLTIDYGPYAFMDVFDPFHICNHSDDTGRYSYMHQPSMIVYALRALLNALAPLIGAELESGKAIKAGWATVKNEDGTESSVSEDKVKSWRESALTAVKEDMEKLIQETSSVEYGNYLRKRLGLRKQLSNDESIVFRPLLDLMQDLQLDFHAAFRQLSYFRPSFSDEDLDKFVDQFIECTPDAPRGDQRAKAAKEVKVYLDTYSKRIKDELDQWNSDEDYRQKETLMYNPRFVLRQWVLEEVIAATEKDSNRGKHILAKVLHMAVNPFEPWGNENDAEDEMDDEIKEERRLCGFGPKKFLGFQCSCSS